MNWDIPDNLQKQFIITSTFSMTSPINMVSTFFLFRFLVTSLININFITYTTTLRFLLRSCEHYNILQTSIMEFLNHVLMGSIFWNTNLFTSELFHFPVIKTSDDLIIFNILVSVLFGATLERLVNLHPFHFRTLYSFERWF